jgi:hypothetical protein
MAQCPNLGDKCSVGATSLYIGASVPDVSNDYKMAIYPIYTVPPLLFNPPYHVIISREIISAENYPGPPLSEFEEYLADRQCVQKKQLRAHPRS